MKGYRIGSPEYWTACDILDFEYQELDNRHTKGDLAQFLGYSDRRSGKWVDLLAEFKRLHPEAEGVWFCSTTEEAEEYYGYFYGDGATMYEVEYEPENVVIDLGGDGIFAINPTKFNEFKTITVKNYIRG